MTPSTLQDTIQSFIDRIRALAKRQATAEVRHDEIDGKVERVEGRVSAITQRLDEIDNRVDVEPPVKAPVKVSRPLRIEVGDETAGSATFEAPFDLEVVAVLATCSEGLDAVSVEYGLESGNASFMLNVDTTGPTTRAPLASQLFAESLSDWAAAATGRPRPLEGTRFQAGEKVQFTATNQTGVGDYNLDLVFHVREV